MAERNVVIENLKVLTAETCTEEWVKSVWESEFTDVGTLDEASGLDTGTLSELLESLRSGLDAWNTQSENEGLWTALVQDDVSLKAIVAMLAYLVVKGHKKASGVAQKQVGLSAAMVYYKLVMSPGSSAFQIFHPEPFEKSVDYFKQYSDIGSLGSAKRKRSLTPAKSSQGRRTKSRSRSRDPDPSFDDDDDDEEASGEMAPQEINRLRKSLHTLLQDLISFLSTYSLRSSVSTAYHTVQILGQLSRQDAETFDSNFENSSRLDKLSVPALAFKGLQLLCSQLHGNVNTMMNATCKTLLPSLLMLIGDKSVQNINKQLQTIRDQAINFICHLIKQFGERGLGSVRTLIQHMCTKVTDRAEYRTRVSQAVVTIVQALPLESYSKMVQWIHKLSRHNQMSNRGFAIEIVSALLATPEKQVAQGLAPELIPYTSHRSLLGILLDKCSDKAPTVRARAVTCFASCLGSQDEHVVGTMRDMVTPALTNRGPGPVRLLKTPGASVAGLESISEAGSVRSEVTIAQQTVDGSTVAVEGGEGQAKEGETPLQGIHLTPGFNPNLTDSEGVFSMLRRRAKDEKVNVRKAALQALESAVRFEGQNYTRQNVEVLKDHCNDQGLSVRKQAMQSLTDLLLERPKDQFLQMSWLSGALPLVLDREQTLSDKCMETLESLVLTNIVPHHRSKSESHSLAWSLLSIISKPASVDQRRYLQKACHSWARQGKIKPGLITALESHIGTDNNKAAWMILAEIAPAAPKINHGFLINYWNSLEDQDCPVDIMQHVLTVMTFIAKHLPEEDRERLITDLKSRLLQYHSPPELISVTIATLSKLCEVQANDTGNQSVQRQWCDQLLSATDQYLSSVILDVNDTRKNEDLIVCHLFTLGEVAQLCPGKVPKRARLLVMSIIATPCITTMPSNQSKVSDHSGEAENLSHDKPAESQNSQGSADSQETQSSQASSQGSSQPLSQFRGSSMSSKVRAYAFIALGKLCLQNEALAKKCVAAIARELEIATDPVIRNNVMIVMCDLCVRYTTTANQYIGNIASCLKDQSPLVRRQTLTMITRLLQEDFLKWKGALFYRFIATLLDEAEGIKEFAEVCLLHLLIKRHPNLFFQHFMECLFHFNDYREHTIYNKFTQTDKDRQLFSLKGEKNTKKRLQLYKFLLENMSDEHKLQLQSKMCQEVLGAIVDGILPLNADTSAILKDTLAILSSKDIKLSSLKVRNNLDAGSDIQEIAAVVTATAKKYIITQIVKKNVVENIIPIVVGLKHMLDKKRSPLLREVLRYLQEMMKDYKNEVQEVLSADRQLATEIEFDMRKFEEQKQQEARQQNATPSVQGSPTAAQQLRSPRSGSTSPAVRSPARKVPGTPQRQGLPVTGLSSPKAATPAARSAPLSTLAVLNSARKVMELSKTTRKVTTETEDNISGRKKVSIATPEVSESEIEESSPTPTRGTRPNYRAISTPSVAIGNITFHGDSNMTFMPPSPIAESCSSQHLYDESNSLLSQRDTEEHGQVLILKPLPNGAAKPNVWNVSSPPPKKKTQTEVRANFTQKKVRANSDSDNPSPLNALPSDEAKENKAAADTSQSKKAVQTADQSKCSDIGNISQSKKTSKENDQSKRDKTLEIAGDEQSKTGRRARKRQR